MPLHYLTDRDVRIVRDMRRRVYASKSNTTQRLRPNRRPRGERTGGLFAKVIQSAPGATWDGTTLTPGKGRAQLVQYQADQPGDPVWKVESPPFEFSFFNGVPGEDVAVDKIIQLKFIDGFPVVDVEPCDDVPGLASVSQSTPTDYGVLDSDWDPITSLDTERFPSSGMTFNTTNSQFSFTTRGLWDLRVQIFMEHNSSNQGRSVSLRLYNVTQATAVGDSVEFGIGRNVTESSLPITIRAIIDNSPGRNVGDTYRVEISGGTDTITDVQFNNAQYDFTRYFTP